MFRWSPLTVQEGPSLGDDAGEILELLGSVSDNMGTIMRQLEVLQRINYAVLVRPVPALQREISLQRLVGVLWRQASDAVPQLATQAILILRNLASEEEGLLAEFASQACIRALLRSLDFDRDTPFTVNRAEEAVKLLGKVVMHFRIIPDLVSVRSIVNFVQEAIHDSQLNKPDILVDAIAVMSSLMGEVGWDQPELMEDGLLSLVQLERSNLPRVAREALVRLGRLAPLMVRVAESPSRPASARAIHAVIARVVWRLRAHARRVGSLTDGDPGGAGGGMEAASMSGALGTHGALACARILRAVLQSPAPMLLALHYGALDAIAGSLTGTKQDHAESEAELGHALREVSHALFVGPRRARRARAVRILAQYCHESPSPPVVFNYSTPARGRRGGRKRAGTGGAAAPSAAQRRDATRLLWHAATDPSSGSEAASQPVSSKASSELVRLLCNASSLDKALQRADLGATEKKTQLSLPTFILHILDPPVAHPHGFQPEAVSRTVPTASFFRDQARRRTHQPRRRAQLALLFEVAAASAASTSPGAAPWQGTDVPHEKSPLHTAVLMVAPDAVAVLLAAGVDPTVRDVHGLTPLALARALLDHWDASFATWCHMALRCAPEVMAAAAAGVFGGGEPQLPGSLASAAQSTTELQKLHILVREAMQQASKAEQGAAAAETPTLPLPPHLHTLRLALRRVVELLALATALSGRGVVPQKLENEASADEQPQSGAGAAGGASKRRRGSGGSSDKRGGGGGGDEGEDESEQGPAAATRQRKRQRGRKGTEASSRKRGRSLGARRRATRDESPASKDADASPARDPAAAAAVGGRHAEEQEAERAVRGALEEAPRPIPVGVWQDLLAETPLNAGAVFVPQLCELLPQVALRVEEGLQEHLKKEVLEALHETGRRVRAFALLAGTETVQRLGSLLDNVLDRYSSSTGARDEQLDTALLIYHHIFSAPRQRAVCHHPLVRVAATVFPRAGQSMLERCTAAAEAATTRSPLPKLVAAVHPKNEESSRVLLRDLRRRGALDVLESIAAGRSAVPMAGAGPSADRVPTVARALCISAQSMQEGRDGAPTHRKRSFSSAFAASTAASLSARLLSGVPATGVDSGSTATSDEGAAAAASSAQAPSAPVLRARSLSLASMTSEAYAEGEEQGAPADAEAGGEDPSGLRGGMLAAFRVAAAGLELRRDTLLTEDSVRPSAGGGGEEKLVAQERSFQRTLHALHGLLDCASTEQGVTPSELCSSRAVLVLHDLLVSPGLRPGQGERLLASLLLSAPSMRRALDRRRAAAGSEHGAGGAAVSGAAPMSTQAPGWALSGGATANGALSGATGASVRIPFPEFVASTGQVDAAAAALLSEEDPGAAASGIEEEVEEAGEGSRGPAEESKQGAEEREEEEEDDKQGPDSGQPPAEANPLGPVSVAALVSRAVFEEGEEGEGAEYGAHTTSASAADVGRSSTDASGLATLGHDGHDSLQILAHVLVSAFGNRAKFRTPTGLAYVLTSTATTNGPRHQCVVRANCVPLLRDSVPAGGPAAAGQGAYHGGRSIVLEAPHGMSVASFGAHLLRSQKEGGVEGPHPRTLVGDDESELFLQQLRRQDSRQGSMWPIPMRDVADTIIDREELLSPRQVRMQHSAAAAEATAAAAAAADDDDEEEEEEEEIRTWPRSRALPLDDTTLAPLASPSDQEEAFGGPFSGPPHISVNVEALRRLDRSRRGREAAARRRRHRVPPSSLPSTFPDVSSGATPPAAAATEGPTTPSEAGPSPAQGRAVPRGGAGAGSDSPHAAANEEGGPAAVAPTAHAGGGPWEEVTSPGGDEGEGEGRGGAGEQEAGGEGSGAGASGPAAQWECSMCTFHNEPGRQQCLVCGTPRPGSADPETTQRARAQAIAAQESLAREGVMRMGLPLRRTDSYTSQAASEGQGNMQREIDSALRSGVIVSSVLERPPAAPSASGPRRASSAPVQEWPPQEGSSTASEVPQGAPRRSTLFPALVQQGDVLDTASTWTGPWSVAIATSLQARRTRPWAGQRDGPARPYCHLPLGLGSGVDPRDYVGPTARGGPRVPTLSAIRTVAMHLCCTKGLDEQHPQEAAAGQQQGAASGGTSGAVDESAGLTGGVMLHWLVSRGPDRGWAVLSVADSLVLEALREANVDVRPVTLAGTQVTVNVEARTCTLNWPGRPIRQLRRGVTTEPLRTLQTVTDAVAERMAARAADTSLMRMPRVELRSSRVRRVPVRVVETMDQVLSALAPEDTTHNAVAQLRERSRRRGWHTERGRGMDGDSLQFLGQVPLRPQPRATEQLKTWGTVVQSEPWLQRTVFSLRSPRLSVWSDILLARDSVDEMTRTPPVLVFSPERAVVAVSLLRSALGPEVPLSQAVRGGLGLITGQAGSHRHMKSVSLAVHDEASRMSRWGTLLHPASPPPPGSLVLRGSCWPWGEVPTPQPATAVAATPPARSPSSTAHSSPRKSTPRSPAAKRRRVVRVHMRRPRSEEEEEEEEEEKEEEAGTTEQGAAQGGVAAPDSSPGSGSAVAASGPAQRVRLRHRGAAWAAPAAEPAAAAATGPGDRRRRRPRAAASPAQSPTDPAPRASPSPPAPIDVTLLSKFPSGLSAAQLTQLLDLSHRSQGGSSGRRNSRAGRRQYFTIHTVDRMSGWCLLSPPHQGGGSGKGRRDGGGGSKARRSPSPPAPDRTAHRTHQLLPCRWRTATGQSDVSVHRSAPQRGGAPRPDPLHVPAAVPGASLEEKADHLWGKLRRLALSSGDCVGSAAWHAAQETSAASSLVGRPGTGLRSGVEFTFITKEQVLSALAGWQELQGGEGKQGMEEEKGGEEAEAAAAKGAAAAPRAAARARGPAAAEAASTPGLLGAEGVAEAAEWDALHQFMMPLSSLLAHHCARLPRIALAVSTEGEEALSSLSLLRLFHTAVHTARASAGLDYDTPSAPAAALPSPTGVDEALRLAESGQWDSAAQRAVLAALQGASLREASLHCSRLRNALEHLLNNWRLRDSLLPPWAFALLQECPFLVPLAVRRRLLHQTAQQSFRGPEMRQMWVQATENMDPMQVEGVDRARGEAEVERALALITCHGPRSRLAAVSFHGETGTGAGIKREFFSVAAGTVQARDVEGQCPAWMDDDFALPTLAEAAAEEGDEAGAGGDCEDGASGAEAGASASQRGPTAPAAVAAARKKAPSRPIGPAPSVRHPDGLFPAPLARDDPRLPAVLRRMVATGRLVGLALVEQRCVGVRLAPATWDLLLGRPERVPLRLLQRMYEPYGRPSQRGSSLIALAECVASWSSDMTLEDKARCVVRDGHMEIPLGDYLEVVSLTFEDHGSGADPRTGLYTREGRMAIKQAQAARKQARDAGRQGSGPGAKARSGGDGARATAASSSAAPRKSDEAEAAPKAEEVTVANVEEYVRSMARFLQEGGIAAQLRALRRGVAQLIPLDVLRMFTASELCLLLNGEPRVEWDTATLNECLLPVGGLQRSSPLFRSLVEVLASLSHSERRAFLQFATGSPQLPIGGLRALRPALSVAESMGEGVLITASTCFHKINLPRIQSQATLHKQLLLSVHGANGLMDRT